MKVGLFCRSDVCKLKCILKGRVADKHATRLAFLEKMTLCNVLYIFKVEQCATAGPRCFYHLLALYSLRAASWWDLARTMERLPWCVACCLWESFRHAALWLSSPLVIEIQVSAQQVNLSSSAPAGRIPTAIKEKLKDKRSIVINKFYCNTWGSCMPKVKVTIVQKHKQLEYVNTFTSHEAKYTVINFAYDYVTDFSLKLWHR